MNGPGNCSQRQSERGQQNNVLVFLKRVRVPGGSHLERGGWVLGLGRIARGRMAGARTGERGKLVEQVYREWMRIQADAQAAVAFVPRSERPAWKAPGREKGEVHVMRLHAKLSLSLSVRCFMRSLLTLCSLYLQCSPLMRLCTTRILLCLNINGGSPLHSANMTARSLCHSAVHGSQLPKRRPQRFSAISNPHMR